MNHWICLTSRSLVALSGKDAIPFLQGLVTQNIFQSTPQSSALLTPQGRFHSDFFIIPHQDRLILECDHKHHASLLEILKKFSVFHQVSFQDISQEYGVCVGIGRHVSEILNVSNETTLNAEGVVFYQDPRTLLMGVRALVPYKVLSHLPHPLLLPSLEGNYHSHRLRRIVPEGAYDLIVDKSIILEYNYHNLGALCWEKGCYMGQELMARTYNRGEIRKKPYGLRLLHGSFPIVGTELFHEADKIGLMGSHCKDVGLACFYVAQMHCMSQSERLDLTWGDQKHQCVVSVFEKSISEMNSRAFAHPV